MKKAMMGMAAAALLVAAPMAATAQQPGQAQPPAAQPRQQPGQGQADLPGVQPGQPVINLPGPIDSPQDALETARMAFVMADADGDGQISQEEATSAGHLMVGGLFFRADQDGDGAVTQEEAEQVRQQVLQQQPVLRFVLDRASRDNTPEGVEPNPAGTNPEQAAQAAWSLIDGNNDGQIQATEVRQAVQTGVQALYTVADTDRDGQMSPGELNAAMYGAVQAGLQAAFQAADQDNSGSLSKEEFSQAIVRPSYTVFDILDRDLDGQLAPRELEMAGRIVVDQIDRMTVDTPRNSPVNVIGSGRLPQGTDIPVPAQRNQPAQPNRPGQPAQPNQPAQPGQPR